MEASQQVEKIDVATGTVLCCYDSAAEAGRITRIDRSSIHKVCTGRGLTAGGFFWRFKGSNATQPRSSLGKNAPVEVEQIDVATGTVQWYFESIAAAARCTGIDAGSISKVCTGVQLTTGGFFWRYKGSNVNVPSLGDHISMSNGGVAKEVEQLDSTTGMVLQWFASAKEATRKTGVDDASISQVCTGKARTAGGFFWRFKGSNATQPRSALGKSKEIEQISLDTGAVICCFASITDAKQKTGISTSTISNVCAGKLRTAGGSFWRYKGSNATQPRALKYQGNAKEVEQVDCATGTVLRCFASMTDAADYVGITAGSIGKVCAGKKRKVGECFWRYKESDGIHAYYSSAEALASLSTD